MAKSNKTDVDISYGIADSDMVLWDHLGGQQTLTDYANNGNKFVIDTGSADLDKVKQDSPAPSDFHLLASVISADRLSSTLGAGTGPDPIGFWNYSWSSVSPGLGQLIRVEEMLPGTEVTNYNLDVLSVITQPPPTPPPQPGVEQPNQYDITDEPDIRFLSPADGDSLPRSKLFTVVVRVLPAKNGKKTIPAGVLISAFYGNDKSGKFVPTGQIIFGGPVARHVHCGIVEEVLCLRHPNLDTKPDRICLRAATIGMFKNERKGDKKYTARTAKLMLVL